MDGVRKAVRESQGGWIMVLMKELLKRKPGLTTREVMDMLGVSRSKVVRFFERGILKGWKHPATGRMFIDPASVKTLKLIWRRSKPSSESGRKSGHR